MAAKRKTSKKATKSIKNLSQAHGKEEKFEPTTLEQIWGDDGSTTYGTLNENQYANQLDDMNMSDLQTHASTVGIIPIDNRSTLRERLLRDFRKHVSSYKKPTHQTQSPRDVNPETIKILSEGR
jgi:hypothetical protein|tara:strand:+ start:670 stop:1041 length:372 start_codon:yes stop_codon:yes gene_type:complete